MMQSGESLFPVGFNLYDGFRADIVLAKDGVPTEEDTEVGLSVTFEPIRTMHSWGIPGGFLGYVSVVTNERGTSAYMYNTDGVYRTETPLWPNETVAWKYDSISMKRTTLKTMEIRVDDFAVTPHEDAHAPITSSVTLDDDHGLEGVLFVEVSGSGDLSIYSVRIRPLCGWKV
jgi:hypothetical protein